MYYKHERFDQIIRFPQIPFTLDLSLVRNHLKLWAGLAGPGRSFTQSELDDRFQEDSAEKVLPFLEKRDKNDFGARFDVMTTAENELEGHWLVSRFSKWKNS